MGKIPEKYAASLRFWILIIVAVYFAYGVYYAASGMRDSIGMLSNQYIYTSLSQNPWWWMMLFYGSEGLTGAISIISRAIAGAFAFYAAFLYWRKKDTTMPTIRKSASTALAFLDVAVLVYGRNKKRRTLTLKVRPISDFIFGQSTFFVCILGRFSV